MERRSQMARIKRLATIVISTLALAAVVLPTSSGAFAAVPSKTPPHGYTSYEVINKKTLSTDWDDKSQELGRCKSNGGTCSIQRGETATRTIGLSLGVSRSVVAGSLNISASTAVTTTVGCTSPKLKKGQVWKAWPNGTRYSYKVKKTVNQPAGSGKRKITTTTSGTLYAFSPRANSISCGF
jgi:hypothetical protein